MQARLKVLHDKANVKQVKLLPVTLIGRSTECNLKIASSQVSRNHCRITLGEDAVYVEDLGSANGTLVDGHLIPAHQPTAISPGAHLIVGPAEFLIDYVASTSATIVLPRTGVPPIPEMPSTEMIFPETVSQFPVQPAAVPQPQSILQPVPVAEAVWPAEPTVVDVPPAEVPVQAFTPEPVNPVPVAAFLASATEAVAASVDNVPGIVQPATLPDTEVLETGTEFGFSVDPEVDQPTEFMFRETFAEATPTTNDPAPTTSKDAPKKGGLKSLFSLFGRKDKPAAGATHQASAPAPAPSVFLPAMDAQTLETTAESPAEPFSFESPVAASAADTVEIEGEQAPQTASEEDDGFQNFLSQL